MRPQRAHDLPARETSPGELTLYHSSGPPARQTPGTSTRHPTARSVAGFLVRGPAALSWRPARVTTNLAMLAGAGLVLATGLIHLHLWTDGYRHIATIGPLFLAQSVVAVVLALAVAATRRLGAALAGAGFQIATGGGLLLSATVGLFGFHDGLDAPWAGSSLVVEGVGAALLLAAAGILAVARRDGSEQRSLS